MKTVLVHSFTDESSPGSPQYLHFFNEKSDWEKACSSLTFSDEFDHSIIYRSSESIFLVQWLNKDGIIQFCGSAAYALAWYAGFEIEMDTVGIHTRHLDLVARKESLQMELNFPEKLVHPLKEILGYPVYGSENDGIYFFDLTKKPGQLKALEIKPFINALQENGNIEIHGLCLFDLSNPKGPNELRYFTPWHGRDEDYVTGSIHQYLTPLVHRIKTEKSQNWRQLSSSPGTLFSNIDNYKVILRGNCILKNLY